MFVSYTGSVAHYATSGVCMNSLRDFIDAARNGEPVELDTTWHQSVWDENSRRVWRRNRNANTRPAASRHSTKWTNEEEQLALDPDYTATEVAELLGRTWESVIRKRSRLRDAGR